MKRTLIFGAGQMGETLSKTLSADKNRTVLGFIDNDRNKWGNQLGNFSVIGGIEAILQQDFDEIHICSLMSSGTIKKQLTDAGINESKIIIDMTTTQSTRARISFLEDYAGLCEADGLNGSVAEGGVFQGDFSKEINRVFPDSKLYLFDTFEGFDARDCDIERKNGLPEVKAHTLTMTSEDIVMSKMPNPQNVIIRKGYFPETAQGVEDSFVFVNLDFDLYQPLLEGLRFFYPRMQSGSIILVHDYFSKVYRGARKAVYDFEQETGHVLPKSPIGDSFSIALIKM